MTYRLTVFSISDRGVLPQFIHEEATKAAADKWRREFRALCAKAGVMIRIDRDPKQLNTTNGDSK